MKHLCRLALLPLLLPVACDDAPTTPAAPLRIESPPVPAPLPASTQPAYRPADFRGDVTALIAARRYADATLYLESADADRQADFDAAGYFVVGQFAIVLPGVASTTDYDPARDWYVPGTQDAIEDAAWQAAATDFARRYNLRRDAAKPSAG